MDQVNCKNETSMPSMQKFSKIKVQLQSQEVFYSKIKTKCDKMWHYTPHVIVTMLII